MRGLGCPSNIEKANSDRGYTPGKWPLAMATNLWEVDAFGVAGALGDAGFSFVAEVLLSLLVVLNIITPLTYRTQAKKRLEQKGTGKIWRAERARQKRVIWKEEQSTSVTIAIEAGK